MVGGWMDGWMDGGETDEWMDGMGRMADGHQSWTRPGLLPSFNPMPHHKKINKEMTQKTAPIQTSTTWEPQAGFPLISRRNYLHPTHLRAEFSSPPGHWHFPAPGSFLAVGGRELRGHSGESNHAQGWGSQPTLLRTFTLKTDWRFVYFKIFPMGCSVLVHWDDSEGGDGKGGGRGAQDGEHMYTHGVFMSMYGKTNTIL